MRSSQLSPIKFWTTPCTQAELPKIVDHLLGELLEGGGEAKACPDGTDLRREN
jgi:hypothetical protein